MADGYRILDPEKLAWNIWAHWLSHAQREMPKQATAAFEDAVKWALKVLDHEPEVNAEGETSVEENNRLWHDGLFRLVRPEKWTPRTPNELPQFVREVAARAPELEVDNRDRGVTDPGALLESELRDALQKANYDYWAVTHPTMGAVSNPYKEGIVIVDDPKEGASGSNARARIAAFLDDQRIARGEPVPCPFCGRTPIVEPWHGGRPDKHVVHCDFEDRCKANPMVVGETKPEAIRNWNTRPEAPK